MKRTRKLWVIAVALGLLMALPVAANAQETDTSNDPSTDHSVESIKARAQEAVDRRLDTLANLERRVINHEYMTAVHKATLTADYADAVAGLITLNRDIQNAETMTELRELVPLIATDVPNSARPASSEGASLRIWSPVETSYK